MAGAVLFQDNRIGAKLRADLRHCLGHRGGLEQFYAHRLSKPWATRRPPLRRS
jgi:hypothetical protein